MENVVGAVDASQDERVTHTEAARIWDVSTRTVDRWTAAGILPQPEKINGRKYHKRRDIVSLTGEGAR